MFQEIYPALGQYWNVTMVLCSGIIILLFYRELKILKMGHEKITEKHIYKIVENWERMNNEYFIELIDLEKYGPAESVSLLHADFKQMLDNKFNVKISKGIDPKFVNAKYLKYISDPELKKFMLDPFEWFKLYYFQAMEYFSDKSYSKGVIGSRKLLPPIRNLENLIINEIDPKLHFRFDSIDEDYEKVLYQRVLKSKRQKAIFLVSFDLVFSLFLLFLGLIPLEALLLFGLGLVIIYLFYKMKF